MAKADEPSSDLPWVLRQKGLKLLDMQLDDEGHTRLLFKSPYGPIREVIITMLSDKPVTWVYGYTIRDRNSKTRVTYSGKHGDPAQDEAIDIEGF